MDITPKLPEGRQVIESYGGGGFKVSGQAYEGSVVVTPEATRAWPLQALRDLDPEDLERHLPLRDGAVILLGCGGPEVTVPPALRLKLLARRVEVMETGAACRTYNVLMMEGRLVAAALIAVP